MMARGQVGQVSEASESIKHQVLGILKKKTVNHAALEKPAPEDQQCNHITMQQERKVSYTKARRVLV